MPAVLESEMIGRELAGYRIEAQIGQGGIGAVYRAYDPELKRAVALKLLRVDVVSPAHWPRFEREAKALTALAHRHIVAILDCGVSDSIPFLAMELLDGQTLADALGKRPMPAARVVHLMQELLSALAYVHESGLVHRDLKPGNVFLERLPGGGERVKLLDFGLAKFLDPNVDGSTTLTRTGEVFGTPAYMAPEQWSGDKAGPATDVYSTALICFELVTGRRPFMSEGQDLLHAQLVELPPLIHEACKSRVARPELERVLQRALLKHPSARQADAAELAMELKAIPEPWFYEGREVTSARRSAASAARDAVHMATAPTLVRVAGPGKSARPAPKSAIGGLFHGFALFSAWTLSIASLIVIGVAATMIYLARDSTPLEVHGVLERALPELAATVRGSGKRERDSVDASVADPQHTDRTPTLEQKAPSEPLTKRAASGPREPARNPWQAPLPRELRPLRWKLEVGQEGDHEMVKELRRYSRKQNKDPRGPLLLARLNANRDQWDAAVAQYKVAFDRDASSRGDPRMLKDLVSAAARKESSWRAAEVIPVIYGREALEEIQRVLRRTRDDQERLRLEQLAHTLAP